MIWERYRFPHNYRIPDPEPEWSNVGWHAGFPDWNRGGVADIVNFRENVTFQVVGCYQEEAMVLMAYSLKG